ncbi:MAG: twin-arginine translocation signal domain-containing protein [Pirellulaceae bacterium]|nr:twin-arginine translocation signal domain-containing protein [Pirellulaceae bacterium]
MSGQTTRRGFLGKAAAVGGCLVLPGLSGAARIARSVEPAVGSSNSGLNAPITVVTQSISTDLNPRANTWIYITEVLQRAGLFFDTVAPGELPSLVGRPNSIVLLAGDLRLTSDQRDALTTLVQNGGSIIGIGGASGLEDVFGASINRPLTEGWIKVTAEDHPITAGLRSSLHVFGGYAMKPGSATSLAELDSGYQGAKGSAIVENRCGKGRAVLLSPDLLFSIVHIQQGLPVLQDAKPAPDGSAPFNDGELKSEDGFVLDWDRDRTPMKPDDGPAFLEPITDELREIILRSVLYVAKEQGTALPMLWYWPRGLKAVGHISHDTDGNDPQKAVALLEVTNRCNVKTTWCTLYPGGYPKEFYGTLKDQDYEIALHYDARSGGAKTSWSKENFLLQHSWLMKEAGLEHITSNKNHYTRWEGRLDYLRWCEEVGMNSDQTRGPSKKGATGFPLGGSQPYFPLDDEAESPRFLDVLEINMMTQDLVVVCPREYGKQLVDTVLPRYGVAHFLFHPAHIQKPNVADSFSELVDYARAQGLEWWTNEQVYLWEALRRSVEAKFDASDKFTLHAAKPVREATLLFLKTQQEPSSININGQAAQSNQQTLHGFEFDAVAMDLAGEMRVQIG